ncbi:MAG TPA: alpha/beta hydrolase [Thermoanaerobaculia bacterium]|nr:alpha/beta hydrolase [Thermoanaerobaculia bacterium]
MHNTILWLHGFPLSADVFAPQRSIDATHVMPNLPGFGGTPARAGMTMDDYARYALEQLDQVTNDPVTLAGVSMGGYIVFAIARLAPERIARLLLIDTRETADDEKGRRGRFEMIDTIRAHGMQPVVDAMLPKMLTSGATQEQKDAVRDILLSASPEGAIAALGAMANRPDSSALLPALHVPALVVVGENDPITPPDDSERMSRALPQARLLRLAPAAHLSHYEQAAAFNSAVEAWLTESSR